LKEEKAMNQNPINLNGIATGTEVCDLKGEKVGTVEHIYRLATLPDGPRSFSGYIAVKTGLLGLGKHYYVPTSSIDDVTSECVCLAVEKTDPAFDAWVEKPGELADSAS